jgi:hypothetical protein
MERPGVNLYIGCGTAMIVALILAFFIELGVQGEQDRAPVRYVSYAVAHAETRHLRFTYPQDVRGRAVRLIARADEGYALVRDALGAKDGDPIVVDLTERSAEHSGLTAWQKIVMDITEEEDEAAIWHTFLHETTHAVSLQECARKMSDQHRAVRFFSEGLAEHVALRTSGDRARLVASRRHAAAACARQELPFEVLADDERLHLHHDPHLVYPVGETWVEALVRCHGTSAPGDVLRAMARPDAPRGLAPLPFWQDTLHAAGFDLERVDAAWHALLRELARDEAAFLATVPRLSGGVSGLEDGDLVLVATLDRDAPADTTYVARLRESQDTPDHELIMALGVPDPRDPRRVTFRVPRARIQGRRFDLQLGAHLRGMHLPICEPWQAAVVPR